MDQLNYLFEGEGWTTIRSGDAVYKTLVVDLKEREVDPDEVTITETALNFYDDVKLYRVTGGAALDDSLGLFLLCDGDRVIHLNGTSMPIFEKNKGGINITEDTALYYLVFFCFFVRGEEGPFMVIDRMDNPLLPDSFSETDPAKRDVEATEAHRLFRPPELFGTDEDGRFRASSMIFYSDAIFVVDFLIDPSSGTIEMLQDEPVMGKLKARSSFKIHSQPKNTS